MAKAHCTEDAQLIDGLVDVIGKKLEGESGNCSGLVLLLFMKMRDNYSDRITSTFSGNASVKVSNVVVEPYNSTLSIDQFLENSDDALILYNESHNILKPQEPKYAGLNWGNDSSIVASLRFDGKFNGN